MRPSTEHIGGVAVIVVASSSPVRIVAISRGANLRDWNLPGGKVDPGEVPVHAAVRELREETGILAEPRFLVPVMDCQPPGRNRAITYLAFPPLRWPQVLQSVPWEGEVAVVDPRQVVAEHCTFARSNLRALKACGLL